MIYTGAQVYDNIFSKLIDIDTGRSFYGVLATEWTPSDETTWVFDLVTNATFHNGEPFTPDDVVYTFERILDPATASAYASLFDSIDSVTTTGDAQVTFTLKTPFGPFLTNLANNGQIVNQVAIEAATRRATRSAPGRSSSSSGSRASTSRWRRTPTTSSKASRTSTRSSCASCSSTRAASTACARASCSGSTPSRCRSSRR